MDQNVWKWLLLKLPQLPIFNSVCIIIIIIIKYLGRKLHQKNS